MILYVLISHPSSQGCDFLAKTLRRNAESVIEGLLDASHLGSQGVKSWYYIDAFSLSNWIPSTVTDLVKPDCNQARVNKCLIALINRKIVSKTSNTVRLEFLGERSVDDWLLDRRVSLYILGWGCLCEGAFKPYILSTISKCKIHDA